MFGSGSTKEIKTNVKKNGFFFMFGFTMKNIKYN